MRSDTFLAFLLAEGCPVDLPWFVVAILLTPFIVFIVLYVWLFRAVAIQKAKDFQERRTMDVHCLSCGAFIDLKKQSCQTCGWTWK